MKTKRFRKRHITPMCQGQLIIFTGYFFHRNLQFSTDNFLFCFFTLHFFCQVLKIYFYPFTCKKILKIKRLILFYAYFAFYRHVSTSYFWNFLFLLYEGATQHFQPYRTVIRSLISIEWITSNVSSNSIHVESFPSVIFHIYICSNKDRDL